MDRVRDAPGAVPGAAAVERVLDALVPVVVAEVLRRVDLTALIIRHVDLDRVLAEVDLPEIIRESTGSLVSDSVHRVRLGGVAADEAVERLRTRLRSTGSSSR